METDPLSVPRSMSIGVEQWNTPVPLTLNSGTRLEQPSLKALANKVLQRNALWNTIGIEAVPLSSTNVEPVEHAERASIAESDGCIPGEWVDGFAKLQTMSPPSDMPPKRWEQVINDAGLFLDCWAAQATALGWTTRDVFGIHESKAYGGIHCAGLVALMGGNAVTAITADRASIQRSDGVTNTYYRRPPPQGQVALWELQP